jgi:zinc/manganese transport system permease protein
MPEIFALDFVRAALLVSICMGLLLSYLGTHVVKRGIVFVDLALGQISMMGVAFAAYHELEPTIVAILFTLVGAFLMSFIKVSDKRLKVEAIIGIVYAVTSAVTVLLISKAAHGDADIQEVLFGSFFTVTMSEIWWMAGVFALLGIVQFVFRKNFAEVTQKFADHDTTDLGVFNVWNFVFYLSVGLAIVLAVKSGGVIPVFSFIVVPPVAAMLITRNTGATVVVGFVIAFLGSVLGIYFSVQFDFPAGSSIVAMLGGLFVLASIVRLVRR